MHPRISASSQRAARPNSAVTIRGLLSSAQQIGGRHFLQRGEHVVTTLWTACGRDDPVAADAGATGWMATTNATASEAATVYWRSRLAWRRCGRLSMITVLRHQSERAFDAHAELVREPCQGAGRCYQI